MLGLLRFKKDLLVTLNSEEKPRKFSWNEFGQHVAQQAFSFSKCDVKAMRARNRSELFSKFINAPSGTGMLSTAFYLWNSYTAMSSVLAKGNKDKNIEQFVAGFEKGLGGIKAVNKKESVFQPKQCAFIISYFHYLLKEAKNMKFDSGTTYSKSVYKYYNINCTNDPVLLEEQERLAKFMVKRSILVAKKRKDSLKIVVL